jgi:site-specific DNA recombinase
MAELRAEVKRAKAESSKATTEYESMKAEMVKGCSWKKQYAQRCI